ncbi:MAG: hypothetical protein C0173_00830, partial [Desulfurella sp.]
MSEKFFSETQLLIESNRNVSNKNVIVVQPLGLGDLVATEPLSRYLRKQYPQAKISWTSSKKYREIIELNPNIDSVIEIESILDWHKSIKPNIDLDNTLVIDLTLAENPKVNVLNYYFYGSLLESFCLSANLPKLCKQPRLYATKDVKNSVKKLALPS